MSEQVGTSASPMPDPVTRHAEYTALIERLRSRVPLLLPPRSRLLVVSRGDQQLLQIPGADTGHFPQADDGRYAGHYPADSSEATAHLEQLRRTGAQYLLFPATALWWLDHYAGLREHLEGNYQQIHRDDDFALYALTDLTYTEEAIQGIVVEANPQWDQILALVDAVLPPACPLIVLQPSGYTIGESGQRVLFSVELEDAGSGGQLRDSAGLPVSFRLRDAVRDGIDYVLVPHPSAMPNGMDPVVAKLAERHPLILRHRDVCTVFETRQAHGEATVHHLRSPSSSSASITAREERRGSRGPA